MTRFAKEQGQPKPVPPLGERVIDQVRDHAIFMLDDMGRMATWNEGVRQVFGYAEDEWLGQPARLIFTEADVASGAPELELEAAMATGRANDDRWLRRKDGQAVYGVGTVSRIDGPDGRLDGFLKVVRDYTAVRHAGDERTRLLVEESRARAQAAEQSAALTAAIEAIPHGVYMGTAEGITRCNPPAAEMLGLASPEEMQLGLADFCQRFRVRKEREGPLADVQQLPFAQALRGEPAASEVWATRASGEDIFLRATAAPIVVEGQVVGAVGVNTDLTDHLGLKQRQSELNRVRTTLGARDQELRALVEGVREYAIFTVGTDGLISSWHEGAALMKGYSAEEAIGMPFANLFIPEERAAGRPEYEMKVAAETGEYQGDGKRLRKNGEIFEAAVVLTALRAPSGEVLGYLKLTQDITARRLQERHQQEALRNAEAARNHAERVSQSMGEFLATISHELRTPLSAILGWATVLSRDATSPDLVNRAVEAIMRNARVQISLIEDLLDMNRIETGQLRLDMQRVDLSTVVAGAIEAVLPAARAKGVHLHSTLEASVGRVAGDPARLQQVVWNLLMNAVKFTPKGGEATVSLKQEGDNVVITVADNGQGVEQAFLPHLFDRFRQQDSSTTRRHGGLGIGLAIVRQLTQLHGGSVRAESDGPGQGARFTVQLPALTELLDAAFTLERPGPSRSEESANEALRRLQGVTVLLVDDEADAREVASYVLGHAGARVLRAGGAKEALGLLERERPDLLLSDIGMPVHDGYELIRWVRVLPPEAGGATPAIALTAYAAPEDRRRIAEAGYSAQLVKPVEPSLLVATIADALRDRGAGQRRAAG